MELTIDSTDSRPGLCHWYCTIIDTIIGKSLRVVTCLGDSSWFIVVSPVVAFKKKMTEHEELETEVENGGEIITLFGIDGPVGKHFVKLALSAGYHIQALSPTPVELEHEYLTVYEGDLSVEESILEELLRDSTYVVCLLSDATPRKEYPEGLLYDFIQRLYPLMKESPIRVFLYQVSLVLHAVFALHCTPYSVPPYG